MCERVDTYMRIVIPALCCIAITAFMNEQLLKHVYSALTLIKKRCYSPVYLHALMAAEEWEAGEKSETQSVG